MEKNKWNDFMSEASAEVKVDVKDLWQVMMDVSSFKHFDPKNRIKWVKGADKEEGRFFPDGTFEWKSWIKLINTV